MINESQVSKRINIIIAETHISAYELNHRNHNTVRINVLFVHIMFKNSNIKLMLWKL